VEDEAARTTMEDMVDEGVVRVGRVRIMATVVVAEEEVEVGMEEAGVTVTRTTICMGEAQTRTDKKMNV
tara:strand:- start:519 stop:725 length:207 start_codon:yes stop_codon:yes gene_type:complete